MNTGVKMAKRGKKRVDTRGPLQRAHDREVVAAEQGYLAVITDEQRAKGTYDGERRIVNRGGTPVMRWIAAGKLSETQGLAIQTCLRLWAICGLEQRTTASYGENITATDHESEHKVNMLIEAREDLYRIMGYFKGLEGWWQVFENVCRFNEPAGVAGSRLGSTRGAEDRAHTTVCFVADIIATKERLMPVTRIIACA